MRFLITGAYGFVGTNLCKYLTGKGHTCDALDIPAAKREGVPYAHTYTWDQIEVKASGLHLGSYDAIVHLAGKAHDLKKVASEQSYFDINVGLTQRIFDALCEQVKVQGEEKVKVQGEGEQRKITFIYFSSSKADANGNAYGRSKLKAEEYLKSAVHLHLSPSPSSSPSPLSVAILRPAMIHGPGNKGNLNLLWGVARRGIPWPLAAFKNKRSFTSIGNICAVVEALAALNPPNPSKPQNLSNLHCPPTFSTYSLNVFPIADDAMLSTNRLIELMAEATGRKPRLWHLPRGLMTFAAKIGDVLHLPLNTERLGKLTEDSFVDNTALKKMLGWTKMPIDAEDGMRATLQSFAAANP